MFDEEGLTEELGIACPVRSVLTHEQGSELTGTEDDFAWISPYHTHRHLHIAIKIKYLLLLDALPSPSSGDVA